MFSMEWKKATCNGNKDFELCHCEASEAYNRSIAQGPVLLMLTPPSLIFFLLSFSICPNLNFGLTVFGLVFLTYEGNIIPKVLLMGNVKAGLPLHHGFPT